jgi:DNA repair protein RadC
MPSRKPSGIAKWPEDERPREQTLSRGAHALTDAELLAILLRVGVQGKNAVTPDGHIIVFYKGEMIDILCPGRNESQ